MPWLSLWSAKMKSKPKTITREELARLSFCNSSSLPSKVNVDGHCMEWVGIGWINLGPARKGIITVIEK